MTVSVYQASSRIKSDFTSSTVAKDCKHLSVTGVMVTPLGRSGPPPVRVGEIGRPIFKCDHPLWPMYSVKNPCK